jgi:serine protease Do
MDTHLTSTQRIKYFFKHPLLKVFLVSFLTMLVTIGILMAIAWRYRTQIFKVLATGNQNQSQLLTTAPYAIPGDVAVLPVPVADSGGTVVDAVKKARPAVVSIVVSKEVPKYTVSYEQGQDPFGGMFGNMFPSSLFRTPVYTPNGTQKKQIGSGSGFLISSDGLILTNRHVVADTSAVYEVMLNSGKKYIAKVLARDPVLDVALIKITATGLPYLEFGNSDVLDVGQTVIAIGNALGEFKNTVSVGVVSGLSRSITAGDQSGQSERLSKVIQTDAAINPGNSGGPLLNLDGKVIGINVAVVQGSSNVGFALPVNSVKSAVDSVRKTGKIVRPYIGLRYVPITAELKTKNNLSVDYGILVAKGATASDIAIIPGSPANKAGIVENDIILEVDGQKIDEENDFASLIRSKGVGDTIVLKILSKGIERIVTLRLEQAPDTM